MSPLGKRKINRGKLGAGLKGMKIRRVGQIKGQGTVESHGESLFRAFSASVIRAQPDRILSPSPGYTPRNRTGSWSPTTEIY